MHARMEQAASRAAAGGRDGARRVLDAADRRLVAATEAGLPLVAEPFALLGRELGMPDAEVMARFRRMIADGVVRRIAAVPNHYALGYRANGMSVWDVDDGHVRACGEEVGALPFVSHCYHRPRHPPAWPYNLFAMVHGRTREEIEAQVREIARVLGRRQRAHDVLYSKRILKKTGMRLAAENAPRS